MKIDFSDSQEVFNHVTNSQTNSKSASAVNLSRLYICGKISINTFQTVKSNINKMVRNGEPKCI